MFSFNIIVGKSSEVDVKPVSPEAHLNTLRHMFNLIWYIT